MLHSLQVWERVCGSFGVATSFRLAESRINLFVISSPTVHLTAILDVLDVLGSSAELPGPVYREPSGHWGGICVTSALNVRCAGAERGLSVLTRPELRSESVLGQPARLPKRVFEREISVLQ